MIYIKNSAPACCLYFPERICLTAQSVQSASAGQHEKKPFFPVVHSASGYRYSVRKTPSLYKKLHMHLYFLLFCCLWTNPDKIA